MYEVESKEVEKNFIQWLTYNNWGKEDFIKFRTISNYRIEMEYKNNYIEIYMKYGADGKTNIIGTPLIINSDEESKIDAALFLIYVSNILDNANINSPLKRERRNKYFFNITKAFVKQNLI